MRSTRRIEAQGLGAEPGSVGLGDGEQRLGRCLICASNSLRAPGAELEACREDLCIILLLIYTIKAI